MGETFLRRCLPISVSANGFPIEKTNEYRAGILAKLEQKCVYLEVLKNTKSD